MRTRRRVGDDDSGESSDASASAELRRLLLRDYVAGVKPQLLEVFVARAPEEVVDAVRQTVGGLLGSLPSQYFDVSVAALAENLAQLLFSTLMTGYLFRSVQCRRELAASLGGGFSPGSAGEPAQPALPALPGTARPLATLLGVRGSVLRPTQAQAPVPATEYIAELEREVAALREDVAALRRAGASRNNGLVEMLRSMEPANLAELTACAAPDVLDAMHGFVDRLVGDRSGGGRAELESAELARLLAWVLVVGYSLRTLEARWDVERAMGRLPSSPDALALDGG